MIDREKCIEHLDRFDGSQLADAAVMLQTARKTIIPNYIQRDATTLGSAPGPTGRVETFRKDEQL